VFYGEQKSLRFLQWLLLAVIAATTSACGLLPGKSTLPIVSDYSLNAGFAPGPLDVESPAVDSCVSAQVLLPRAAAGYNTARMAYIEDPNRLDFYAYSQWVDTPAYMLQPLLVDALRESGRFRTVVKSPSPVRTRFRLITDDLTVVQQIDGNRNLVRIGLRLQLLDAKEGKLIIDEPMVAERSTEANPRAGAAMANLIARDLLASVAARCSLPLISRSFVPSKRVPCPRSMQPHGYLNKIALGWRFNWTLHPENVAKIRENVPKFAKKSLKARYLSFSQAAFLLLGVVDYGGGEFLQARSSPPAGVFHFSSSSF